MAKEAVELLERQCAYLLRQEDLGDFLVGVEPFLDALAGQPQIAPHLGDLRSEAVAIVNAQEAVEGELLPELRALREDLVRLMPELDDSQRESEPETGEPMDPLRLDHSLARFDQLATEEPTPIRPDGSGGRAGELIRILQAKAGQASQLAEKDGRDEPKEMDDWSRRLGNADSVFQHARRATVLRLRTSAGSASCGSSSSRKRSTRPRLSGLLGRSSRSTPTRCSSGSYAVTEAFCVVFRRGRPRYLLPDVLPGEGYRLYLVLVDIAPRAVSGRRQLRQPIQITPEEMLRS